MKIRIFGGAAFQDFCFFLKSKVARRLLEKAPWEGSSRRLLGKAPREGSLGRSLGRPEKGSGSENARMPPGGPYEFIYIDIDLCTFALIKLLKLGVSAASQSEAKEDWTRKAGLPCIRAVEHRVRGSKRSRLSFVYEMRDHSSK